MECKNGCYILDVDIFIKEIFNSFEDFIDKMDERVNDLINNDLLQGILVDVNLLKKEQSQRKNNLYQQKTLLEKTNFQTGSDWFKITNAIKNFKEMIK